MIFNNTSETSSNSNSISTTTKKKGVVVVEMDVLKDDDLVTSKIISYDTLHTENEEDTDSFTVSRSDSFDEDDDSKTELLRSSGSTHRKLLNRHVQFIAISGVIGTALFVTIGKSLFHGGPAFLLIAFTMWCVPIMAVTMSTAEMVSFLPISSPFLRMASKCADESLAVMASWNFWLLECIEIPFEIVSVNTIIHYWRDDYSAAIPLVVQVVLYLVISVAAVKYYGEMEFWLASFKIILAIGLFCFTFITMLGGNPKHDRYGFRYYGESPFKKYFPDSNENAGASAGYFQGFLACLIQAAFTIAGGEYISMLAGEVKLPRKTMPRAFKQVFYRLMILFLGSCLCVGIVCSPNDPALTSAITESRPGAGSSPYVVAMNNLQIKILPDIVNAALITAAFSAGNAYTYCSSRTLYGMSLDGYAPKVFSKCTKNGVPIYAVSVSLAWALLSLLQLNSNSAIVLNWLINLITAAQLINFACLCLIYLFFRRAYMAQKDRLPPLPFKSWWQPYTAIFGLFCMVIMILLQGYTVFFPKLWSIQDFLFCYLMVFIDIAIYLGYKYLWKRGKDKLKDPNEIDFDTELAEIELHELEHNFDKFRFYHQD